MKNMPSVDELNNVIETVKLTLVEQGFGELFIYDKENIKNKQVNQFCLALFVPLTLKLIDKVEFEGVEKGGENGGREDSQS